MEEVDDEREEEGEVDVEAARDVVAGAAERVVVAEPLVRTLLVIVCDAAVAARDVVLLVEVVARDAVLLVEVVFVLEEVVAVVARDVVVGAVDLAVEVDLVVVDLTAVVLRLTGVEVVVTVACC